MLNTKKGPAVQALRAQADKITYPKTMQETLKNQENLEIKESHVEHLMIKENKVTGIITDKQEAISISLPSCVLYMPSSPPLSSRSYGLQYTP